MKAYAECQRDMEGRLGIVQVQNNEVATPGGLELLLPENIYVGLYPIYVAPRISSRHNLPASLWPKLAERHKTESLRKLAEEYGASHEAVRRTLKKATEFVLRGNLESGEMV